jgi:hypothetical protein
MSTCSNNEISIDKKGTKYKKYIYIAEENIKINKEEESKLNKQEKSQFNKKEREKKEEVPNIQRAKQEKIDRKVGNRKEG